MILQRVCLPYRFLFHRRADSRISRSGWISRISLGLNDMACTDDWDDEAPFQFFMFPKVGGTGGFGSNQEDLHPDLPGAHLSQGSLDTRVSRP